MTAECLSLDEVAKVATIGQLAQECLQEQQFAEIVTGELLSLFESDSAVFMQFRANTDKLHTGGAVSYGIDQQHSEQYLAHYQYQDPCLQGLLADNAGRRLSVSTDQVVASRRGYTNSAYYQDFLKHTGVDQSLIFLLGKIDRPLGLIGLHRSRARNSYRNSDHGLAQIVAPYLSMAVLRQQQQSQLRCSLNQNILMAEALLCTTDIRGFLLLDASGDAIHAAGKLPTAGRIERVWRQFQESPMQPLSDDALRILPLPCNDGRDCFLLLHVAEQLRIAAAHRMQSFALTEREQEVVRLMELGLTNVQVAAALAISRKTVENHLANIFDKTETRNKTDLLRTLNI
jgi:DNA-binding CsgD family transcriptional regulator